MYILLLVLPEDNTYSAAPSTGRQYIFCCPFCRKAMHILLLVL
jgi:hypothetical protein